MDVHNYIPIERWLPVFIIAVILTVFIAIAYSMHHKEKKLK